MQSVRTSAAAILAGVAGVFLVLAGTVLLKLGSKEKRKQEEVNFRQNMHGI